MTQKQRIEQKEANRKRDVELQNERTMAADARKHAMMAEFELWKPGQHDLKPQTVDRAGKSQALVVHATIVTVWKGGWRARLRFLFTGRVTVGLNTANNSARQFVTTKRLFNLKGVSHEKDS